MNIFKAYGFYMIVKAFVVAFIIVGLLTLLVIAHWSWMGGV